MCRQKYILSVLLPVLAAGCTLLGSDKEKVIVAASAISAEACIKLTCESTHKSAELVGAIDVFERAAVACRDGVASVLADRTICERGRER